MTTASCRRASPTRTSATSARARSPARAGRAGCSVSSRSSAPSDKEFEVTQRPTLFTLFALLLAGLAYAAPAHAERIKDMGQFQGLRSEERGVGKEGVGTCRSR